VGGRHLVLATHEYLDLNSFGTSNSLYQRFAVELGEQALRDALDRAGLTAADIDHLFSVSVTGIAVPPIDARLVNRLGLRDDVRRTPIFGLGCVAGAAGVARAADYLRGYPDHVAVVLSVELCSLTLQLDDLSVPNLIACSLFGDGAAAVVLCGDERGGTGPEVLGSRSVFFRDTEDAMGWEISEAGFRVVLSGDVPALAGGIRPHVDAFLSQHGLVLEGIESLVCHPGGPRVLEAFEEALERPREAFELTWKSLWELGNLSSASVLMVLRDTMEERRPPSGSYGLMIAMGPGFCAELVLLRW
ncbi:MAG: 3-oxoacyl-[acyl-carrier-protein] synthase III C-terminal domain-containing protein, partial [Myxococcota bacterium]